MAYSAPSGLVVQPCAYSNDCLEWPGGLGMPACGMLPSGPFDWTWMGQVTHSGPTLSTVAQPQVIQRLNAPGLGLA